MRLIGKPGIPKSPRKFMGKVYRNALPDLFDHTTKGNSRLARLKPDEINAAKAGGAEVIKTEAVDTEPSAAIEQPAAITAEPQTEQTIEALLLASKPDRKPDAEPEPKPKPKAKGKQKAGPVKTAVETMAEPTTDDSIKVKPKRQPFRQFKRQLTRLKPSIPSIPAVKKPRLPAWPALRVAVPHVTFNTEPLVQVILLGLIPLGIVASQTMLYIKPLAGTYVNAATLALLIGIGLWQQRYRALCIVVALIPAAMMVMLSLPNATAFTRTATLYGFLLVFGLVYRHLITFGESGQAELVGEGSSKVGAKGYRHQLPTMIITGQLLGLVGYALLQSHYNFHDTLTPVVAASAVIFALAEEIVFRGLIQQQAMQIMRPLYAATMTTIIFASVTIGQGLPWAPLFALALGASLSYIYARKPNILLTWVVNVACKLTFLGLLSAIS